MDYLLEQRGQKSSLGFAAYQLSNLKTSLRERPLFTHLKGITPTVEHIIQEVLATGSCQQYQDLMRYQI
jgi:DNA polymerase/3'-5' exonuclease PolX